MEIIIKSKYELILWPQSAYYEFAGQRKALNASEWHEPIKVDKNRLDLNPVRVKGTV